MTRRDDVKQMIYDFMPDVIINASAYTNVDLSETERELAWKINVKGVEYIAEAAAAIDAHLIHISTDYVFDGLKGPYTESDKPAPVNYYGRTKLASENAIRMSGALATIVRTNVLYGIIPSGRADFVRWVVNSVREKKQIRIVTDQINNPTFIDDLVAGIDAIILRRKFGIYNISGMEILSRYDFTMRIAKVFDLDTSYITQITTPDLHQPARRPLQCGLIILKAQTELDYKPISLDESLRLMKAELHL
jgi:dTDP-4-dehydrorhamnose reductase